MSRNSSATVHGGAGGRNCRASVTSLQGMRNVMRNDTERDSAPVSAAAPQTKAPLPAAVAPAAPADDKQTMQGLNKRLQDYLGKVKQLETENGELQKEIDDIMNKRKEPEGRNWDEVQAPLEELRQKIKDVAMDNARLLLENDNTKMATDDLKNKLYGEIEARKALEKDLDELKRILDDSKKNQENQKREIDSVKEELDQLQADHQKTVDDLCEKIKRSEVKVDIEIQNSDLPNLLNKMRNQYQKIAEKNQKEMDDWYQSKFDNMKVAEAQNTEALQSGKAELKKLIKDKRSLDNLIYAWLQKIKGLEENMKSAKVENDRRLIPVNNTLLNMENELRRVREEVERQAQINEELVSVKMKLEKEIKKYHELMAVYDSMETADTGKSDESKPKNQGSTQLEQGKEKPAVNQ